MRNSSTYKTRISFIAALLIYSLAANAQDSSKPKRFSAFPFPIIYYAPETRLTYGVAGTATFRFKKDSANVKPSNIFAGLAYTQNKQLLAYAQFQLFYNNNRYYIFGEAGYYKYSYFFYGTGNKEVPEELYKVNYPRIKINAAYKILPHIYAGPGYQYENYNIVETLPGGALATGSIAGSKGSISSGAGLVLLYDSRDTVLFPGKGWFANLSFINYGKFWGGNHNFNRLVLDVTKYQRVSKNIIIAANSYNSFVTGNAPFQQLSQLGGNKLMRGYYQGRYADNNMALLQTEGRFKLYKRFGAALFLNGGLLGNKQDFLRTNDFKYSYGAGMRFVINRKDHLNVRLDYALGPGTSGFYFTFGEAF